MYNIKLENASKFCKDNLLQCCIEMIEMKKTGILPEGNVRELIKLLDFANYSAMSLAEEMIKTAAMEHIVSLYTG